MELTTLDPFLMLLIPDLIDIGHNRKPITPAGDAIRKAVRTGVPKDVSKPMRKYIPKKNSQPIMHNNRGFFISLCS